MPTLGLEKSGQVPFLSKERHGVSTVVLIRVLAATGYRAEVRVKKAAA
jgi:hypothetical protein